MNDEHKSEKMIRTYTAASVALLLVIVWGCGDGEYEQRLDERIKELSISSKFNVLSPSSEVPGTSVSIRIPKDFKNPPLTEGAVVDDKPVDSRRVKANVVEIPELKLTYEGSIVDANGGKQPYYLYVAVSTNPNRVNFPRSMQSELNVKFNDTTQPTDYPAQTPEGRSVTWKQCRGTGSQDFYYVSPSGEGQFRKMTGSMQLFFLDANDTLVTLAWRMPVALESDEIKSLMNLVAGCVKIPPKEQ